MLKQLHYQDRLFGREYRFQDRLCVLEPARQGVICRFFNEEGNWVPGQPHVPLGTFKSQARETGRYRYYTSGRYKLASRHGYVTEGMTEEQIGKQDQLLDHCALMYRNKSFKGATAFIRDNQSQLFKALSGHPVKLDAFSNSRPVCPEKGGWIFSGVDEATGLREDWLPLHILEDIKWL